MELLCPSEGPALAFLFVTPRYILSECISDICLAFQTVAAIFSLLNDVRLSKKLPSLGFINPLIYSNVSRGFNDITSGSNPGCGTSGEDSQNNTGVCIPFLMLSACQVFLPKGDGIL
jgi:hypothetical protein